VVYRPLLRWLSRPNIERRLAIAAFVLCLPSLAIGLQADDYDLHAATARGPLQAYAFDDRDPELARQHVLQRRDAGLLPWWTYEGHRQRFLRPLASLSLWLDFRLWPRAPFMLHLHHCVLYAALVWLAGLIYRRCGLSGGALGLATFFYAVNGAQSMTVGWISGRNTLLSALFGFACWLLHARSRADGAGGARLLAAAAACACFALALLSSEGGLAALAYLGAHALLIERAPWRVRALALLPYLAIAGLWLAHYTSAGYGVVGSGFYHDLAGDPFGFAASLAAALPIYLASQLTLPYANMAGLFPGGLWVVAALSLALLVALSPLFAPALAREPRARFFALGAALAVVPLSSTLPQDRLVFFIGLGTCGLLGELVERCFDADGRGRRRTARTLWRLHGVLAPVLFVPMLFGCMGAFLGGGATALERALPRAEQPLVVLVNSPSWLLPHFQARMRAYAGQPASPVVMLYAGGGAVTVTRRDARSLELHVPRGWLATPIERGLRDVERFPMRAGEALRLRHVAIEVLDVDPAGAPTCVRFTFDRALDDSALTTFAWLGRAPAPWTPPPIGRSATLPRVSAM